jgi:hypothetical protein
MLYIFTGAAQLSHARASRKELISVARFMYKEQKRDLTGTAQMTITKMTLK